MTNTNIRYTLCIISTYLLHSIQATNLTDLPHLIHDTASKVKAEAAAAITNDHQAQQQIMHILTSVTGALKLSFSFFKSFFGCLYLCISTVCSPFLWIMGYLWQQFVTKPFELFMHLAHVFYPVTLFCIAAIGCGLFIGSVAGFAAEAFSSILISATWGPQPKKSVEEEEVVAVVAAEDQQRRKKSKNSAVSTEDEEEEELQEETDYEEESNLKRSASVASSIWESSSSFFGVHQTTPKSSEKRPASYRGGHSASSSVSSAGAAATPPVLIRRMKLSSMARKKKLNSGWDWDEEDSSHQDHADEEIEEEEGLYHPSASSSKKKRF